MIKVDFSNNKAVHDFKKKLTFLFCSGVTRFAMRMIRLVASVGIVCSIVTASNSLAQQLLVVFPLAIMFLTIGWVIKGGGVRGISSSFYSRQKICVLVSTLTAILSLALASLGMYTPDYAMWSKCLLATVFIELLTLVVIEMVAKAAIRDCLKNKDVFASIVLSSLEVLVVDTTKANYKLMEQINHSAQTKLFAISVGISEITSNRDIGQMFCSMVNIMNISLIEMEFGSNDGMLMYAIYSRFVKAPSRVLKIIPVSDAIEMAKKVANKDVVEKFGEEKLAQRIGSVYDFVVGKDS